MIYPVREQPCVKITLCANNYAYKQPCASTLVANNPRPSSQPLAPSKGRPGPTSPIMRWLHFEQRYQTWPDIRKPRKLFRLYHISAATYTRQNGMSSAIGRMSSHRSFPILEIHAGCRSLPHVINFSVLMTFPLLKLLRASLPLPNVAASSAFWQCLASRPKYGTSDGV